MPEDFERKSTSRELVCWYGLSDLLTLPEGRYINRTVRGKDGKVSRGYYLPAQFDKVRVFAHWHESTKLQPSITAAANGWTVTKSGARGAIFTRRFELSGDERWGTSDAAPEPIAAILREVRSQLIGEGWPFP